MEPRRTAPPRSFLLALAALAVGLFAAPLQGQYFGKNKVQYETFDFRVLETEDFDVYHYEAEREASVMAARMTERWYARFSRLLDHDLTGRQPLILYANHPDFAQTTALAGNIGEGTGGVTEPLKRRIVLPMAGPLADTDHVLGHELVHAFQYDLTGIDPSSPLTGAPTISRLPLWQVEGMAEYLSIGSTSVLTAMWMRDELLREDRSFPTIRDLQNPRKFFPYRYGHALWSYIAGTFGDDAVKQIFVQGARGTPAQAIQQVTGVPADTLSKAWERATREAYGPVLERTSDPSEFGEPLITEETSGGTINVGPALSPDGRRLVFLSERSRFAIEMYVADAETGEVLRQLTKTAVDPHFQSLQFINSAGTWAPDSRRFAFAAVVAGDPVLTVIDTETGDQVRELKFRQFGEIFNPTWSPDGSRIAFVANDGGFFDLFVVELASGNLRRLTDDPWAEVHPDWSPDGSRIAFATDRFRSDLDELRFGDFSLATIDPTSGEIAPLPSFEDARNTNPQWGPGGRTLYFISDRGGIPNLYRLDVASGETDAITNVNTGVAGITELSPAVTVAREDGRVVFGAYRRGNNDLYRVDRPEALPADRALPAGDREAVVSLPPRQRTRASLDGLLQNYQLGLPSPVTFETHDYHPGLSLDYIAQPTLAAGASSQGIFIGGGAAFLFSDMLGRHMLYSQLQLAIEGGEVLNGIGAMGQYVNQRSRLNWGITAGQMPQIYRFFQQGFGDPDGDGEPELVQDIIRFWEVNRRAVGTLAYPLNSATRLEFGAGFERVDFVLQRHRETFNAFTGQRESERTTDAPTCETDEQFASGAFCEPGSLNEAVATAALVRDVSVAGPLGPVMGQRFRLEGSPNIGTLDYVTALGDFRQYVMPVEPLTFAGRLLHYGRYGSDAEDRRLSQLFIGYPSLVRGYESSSFNFVGCNVTQAGQVVNCPQFGTYSSLFGSRMAVANLEARLPLVGPLGTLSRSSGVPPVDLFGFFDAGLAWTADRDARLNDVVKSVGAGIRTNLLGFAIFQFAWAKPIDRDDEDSVFIFSLTPPF